MFSKSKTQSRWMLDRLIPTEPCWVLSGLIRCRKGKTVTTRMLFSSNKENQCPGTHSYRECYLAHFLLASWLESLVT